MNLSTADAPGSADLGYRPRAWQQHCHRLRRTRPSRFTGLWLGMVLVLVLVVHRRAGKTLWCVIELIDAALEFKPDDPERPGRFAYIAPELKQAKRNAWDYLKAFASRVPGTIIREGELNVEFANGSRISLYGADNPDSLRGIYLDGAVLDEVAQMRRTTWEPVVSIALMDRHGWAVFIGTVNGVDLLSETFFKAQAGEMADGNCIAASFDVYATNVFTAAEIESQQRSMSEQHFRREFLNDFSAGGDEQLISLDRVQIAMRRSPRLDEYDFAAKLTLCDPAFAERGDRAPIYRNQGVMVWPPENIGRMRGIEPVVLARMIAEVHESWHGDHIVIDRGRGEGVISVLRSMGYQPLGVDFGGSPDDPRFVNKKAEIFFQLRESIVDSLCLPNRQELATDLCGLKVTTSARTGKIEVVYDPGLPSPDEAACLALRQAYKNLRPKARTELERWEAQAARREIDSTPYNPFGSLGVG